MYLLHTTSTLIQCAESLYFTFLAVRQSHNETCGRGHCSTRVEIVTQYCRPHLEKPVLKELQNIKYLGEIMDRFSKFIFLFFFSLKQALSTQKKFNNVWKILFLNVVAKNDN